MNAATIITPFENDDTREARRVVAAFAKAQQLDPASRRKERRANRYLALEWCLLIGATYALVYLVQPWWLKVALLIPWSLYSGFALDNITHYANHWALFRSDVANTLWRYSGVLVYLNPLEIRTIHHEHHRAYSRPENAEEVFSAEDRRMSFGRYLARGAIDGVRAIVPWRTMDPCVQGLETQRPARYREIVALRWASAAWFLVLLAFDWANTLLYFVPSVLVGSSFASLVMNMTDHLPGDSRHPFRLATSFTPRTAAERTFSAVNHQTCATHLTHHLFPRVHWVHLRVLQESLDAIYARNAAPKSLLINSALLGNPLEIIGVLRTIKTQHFDMESRA